MIDTDKYEGHTEGLWCWKDGNIVRKAIGNTPLTDDAGLYLIADKHLIADAPLLLAEVKRLREAIVDMIDSMDNYYIRDIQHATGCLRDIMGYYEDEEE
jgi:hypothetical protein